MPKYAPAREDGTKPYVVTVTDWGKRSDRLVYVASAGRPATRRSGAVARTSTCRPAVGPHLRTSPT